MKPGHEINGRYFVEAEVSLRKSGLKEILLNRHIVLFYTDTTDQSLPLGKCFVELEKFYGVGNNSVAYEIKLDQSGKAVVLTELPIGENEINPMFMKACQDAEFVNNLLMYDHKNQQSDDELAKNIFDKYYEVYRNLHNKPAIPLEARQMIFDTMQEYHRVKSEGLFSYKDMSQCWAEAYDEALPLQILGGDKNVKVGNGAVSQTKFRKWLDLKINNYATRNNVSHKQPDKH